MGEVVALRQPNWNGRGEPGDWLADNCGCEVCRSSRPDRRGPRVMTGIEPFQDESLIGLVVRAASRNHVHRTVTITRAASEIMHGHGNLAARGDVDFAQLAWAIKVAPHEIEARRYRAVDVTPDLIGLDFHGAVIPTYDLRLNSRRLATSWLTHTPYHSALGHHRLATHCPVSGDILIDECPRCGTTLTWTTTNLVSCKTCGLDQRDRSAAKIPSEEMAATRIMIDLVHPHPARSSRAVSHVSEALRHMNRGSIFELGWRLGCLFTGSGLKDRDSAWRLSLQSKLAILRAGSDALASWPVSLHAAMTGRMVALDGRSGASLVDDMRKHLRGRNVPAEMTDAVIAAAPGLATSKAAAVKSVVKGGANAAETTRALGVSQRIFERLASAQELDVVLDSGSVNRHRVIEAGALAPLAAKIADRISVGTVSQELGISRHGVEQLCCLGIIEAHHDTAMRTAFADEHVRRSDYDKLVEEIEAAKLPWDPQHEEGASISLRRAVMTIGAREKPWGLILQAMRGRTLPFRLAEPMANGDLVDRVQLDERDVPKVTAMVFLRSKYPKFPFEDRIKRQDVEELLNLNPKCFQQALLHGEVKRGEDRLYSLSAVMHLAEKMISGGEILARWSAYGRKMPRPFRGRKRLNRLHHLGWDRDLVETVMSEHVRQNGE